MSLALNFYTQCLDSWRAVKQDLDRLQRFCRSNQFVPSESHKTVSKTSFAREVQPPPAWACGSPGKSPSPLFHTNGAGSTAAALEGERSSPEICEVTTSLSINSATEHCKINVLFLPDTTSSLQVLRPVVVLCPLDCLLPCRSPQSHEWRVDGQWNCSHITNRLNIFQVQTY